MNYPVRVRTKNCSLCEEQIVYPVGSAVENDLFVYSNVGNFLITEIYKRTYPVHLKDDFNMAPMCFCLRKIIN